VNIENINNLYKKAGKINEENDDIPDITEKLKALTRAYVYSLYITYGVHMLIYRQFLSCFSR
jgi:hypothetical protein